MKLSVCIDSVFQGLDPIEAMRRVKRAGYDGYEFWGWWNKDLNAMLAEQRMLGLAPVAFCTKFFSLVDPADHGRYLDGLEESIAAAKLLGCPMLISQCGADTGAPRDEQHAHMADCLRRAAPLLEAAGVTLLLEPLNLMDHPGYYLTSSEEGARAVREVGSPNVKLLFDLYHQQITEGDLIRHVERTIAEIRHFHSAGNPGRHELNRGELNYKNIFAAIRDLGYDGFVGVEYFPKDPAEDGLRYALALLS